MCNSTSSYYMIIYHILYKYLKCFIYKLFPFIIYLIYYHFYCFNIFHLLFFDFGSGSRQHYSSLFILYMLYIFSSFLIISHSIYFHYTHNLRYIEASSSPIIKKDIIYNIYRLLFQQKILSDYKKTFLSHDIYICYINSLFCSA